MQHKKTKWNTLSQNENLFKKELNIFYIQQWKIKLPFLYNEENNDSFIKESKCKHKSILKHILTKDQCYFSGLFAELFKLVIVIDYLDA